ncbi:flavin reductase family protein [Streptomyces chartreusis]|uniref:flavin reductase family protein n=1 Tax=Streptomyces chartreusis TaxID=1969 RepID=UPI003677567E
MIDGTSCSDLASTIDEPVVDSARFRATMASFASGVTVLTTIDAEGEKYGITASSFTSLSMDPPLVLICVAQSAYSHRAFAESTSFGISVLRDDQAELATRYAIAGGSKFAAGEFILDERTGVPLIGSALSTMICSTNDIRPGGDHSILIGAVHEAEIQPGLPLITYSRTLTTIR